jgi:transposase
MDTIVVEGVIDAELRHEAAAPRRRRSYSLEVKQRLVAESCEPGASVSLVARRHDINANLLFTWRRQMRGPARAPEPMTLIPIEVLQKAEVAAPTVVAGAQCPGEIEIILASGVRVRVDAEVSEAALKRVLSALRLAA